MINFKLMKQQFKSIFIITLIFFIIILLFSSTFSTTLLFTDYPAFTRLWKNGQWYKGWVARNEKHDIFWAFWFRFLFSILLVSKLISKEINNGWMACWLTLPISRKKILNSKLLVIIMAISLISVSELILQLILFTIVYKDFTSTGQLQLVLDNFFKLCLWILWTAIVWFIACIFNKSSTYKIIVYILMALFLFCWLIGTTKLQIKLNSITNEIKWNFENKGVNPNKILRYDHLLLKLAEAPNAKLDAEFAELYPYLDSSRILNLDKKLEDALNSSWILKILTYLPYFSIISFYNFILHIKMPQDENVYRRLEAVYGTLEAVRAKDCAWQIPTMISISAILFTCGNYRFIKKDLPL